MNAKMNARLEKDVLRHLRKMGYDSVEDAARDVLRLGCVSGIVPGLVCYADTMRFYRRHRMAINELLADSIAGGMISGPGDLRGWDYADPLALGEVNQTVLVWFAFEEMLYHLFEFEDLL